MRFTSLLYFFLFPSPCCSTAYDVCCCVVRRVLCIYGVRFFETRVVHIWCAIIFRPGVYSNTCYVPWSPSPFSLLPVNPPGRQPGRHPAAGDRTGPPKPRPRANAVMLSLSLTPARLFFFCCVPFSPRGLLLPRLPLPNPSFPPSSLPPSPRLPNINKHDTNVDTVLTDVLRGIAIAVPGDKHEGDLGKLPLCSPLRRIALARTAVSLVFLVARCPHADTRSSMYRSPVCARARARARSLPVAPREHPIPISPQHRALLLFLHLTTARHPIYPPPTRLGARPRRLSGYWEISKTRSSGGAPCRVRGCSFRPPIVSRSRPQRARFLAAHDQSDGSTRPPYDLYVALRRGCRLAGVKHSSCCP